MNTSSKKILPFSNAGNYLNNLYSAAEITEGSVGLVNDRAIHARRANSVFHAGIQQHIALVGTSRRDVADQQTSLTLQ
jgi:hypothetical protein